MGTAFITNIQKYSIHDGPGIRSTVFFKGCPLLCAWCHNPENQLFTPELVWLKQKCISCGICVQTCPEQALTLGPAGITIDKQRCVLCGRCSEACPTNALEMLGKAYTIEEVLAELDKDRLFYDQSGGGVTLSGGEPLSQGEFVIDLLKACKARGYHTAVDTSGYVPQSMLAQALPYTDLFLYDIKALDPAKHQEYIGAPLGPVADNLRWLAGQGARIWLRIPVIPGVNDDAKEMAAIRDLAKACHLQEVYLLPYHNIAESKYQRLGLPYRLAGLANPKPEQMEALRLWWTESGFNAHIGG